MACSVDITKISEADISKIRSMLCFKAEVRNNFYNRNAEVEDILLYNIEQKILDLPFLFAGSLLNFNPNLDILYPNVDLKFTGQLRENQIPVELEAWGQLQKYGTSTLGLYPGFGKTVLGAKLASRAKLLSCVLVHREILTTQWKTTFENTTNGTVWIVGEKCPPAYFDVIICMDTRWHLIPKSIRDSVGFLIIDEAHAFCTPTHVGCLLAFHPKYILAESASLERDDSLHSMIYAICGTHGVYRESNIPFNVMKIVTNTKPIRKLNRFRKVDYAHLVSSTLHDERRNNIILQIVSANTNFKILILTSLRDHATFINSSLESMGISSDFLCGTKRGYRDSNVLVGTTSKIGTGFDPATSCPSYSGRPFDLLILVCSIKKYSMLVQNVGRVFRSDFPTVMHFVDNDEIFKSHWYIARKWYIARGGIITNHIIQNTDLPQSQNVTIQQQQWSQKKTQELLKSNPKKLSLSVIKPK